MAKLTAYQKQFKRRMQRTMRLRSAADKKVRSTLLKLQAALLAADNARGRMNRLNQLYDVDVSTETDLVSAARQAALAVTLQTMLMQAPVPGEEVVLFNQAADDNGGAELAPEAIFDEPVPVGSPTPSTPAEDEGSEAGGDTAPAISVSQLQAIRMNDSTWNIVVQASAPSGTYHLTNDALPYAYDFQNEHEMAFSLSEMTAGQPVQFTFTDSVNSQVTLQRTLVLV